MFRIAPYIVVAVVLGLGAGLARAQEKPYSHAKPLLPAPKQTVEQASQTAKPASATVSTDKSPSQPLVLQNNVGQNAPAVYHTEAFIGRPYGIGVINYRLHPGDDMIDRSGAAILTEANNRILYPVASRPAAAKFFQNILGNRGSEPESKHSVWFLFKGDQPLNIELLGSSGVKQVVPVSFARKQRKFDRLLDQWWREYNEMAQQSADWGDYPPMIETYLTSMLSHRLSLPLPESRYKNQDPMIKTLTLLFDVESLRAETVRQTINGQIDTSQITQPLPQGVKWQSPAIQVKGDPELEPIARCVPEELSLIHI